MPKQFEFCRPQARKVVPVGDDWIDEVKYDGYRERVIRDGRDVKILSRLDWTWRFPWIAETALKMKQQRFVINGEICVLDVQGISDFNALQSNKHNGEAQLYAFDLVAPEGDDLRELPLFERKARLGKLLARRPEGIFVAPFERGEIGPDLFRKACELGLEGIVSKRRDRPYQAGRSRGLDQVKNRSHPAMSREL